MESSNMSEVKCASHDVLNKAEKCSNVCHGDEYEDLLHDRRNGSDVRFSLKEWQPSVQYKYGKEIDQQTMFSKVLKSDRVQKAITHVLNGRERILVENEVLDILEQMGHALNITMIRKFAFILSKISKRIYSKILINKDGIEKLKQVTPTTPVLLMPTHRSYADFLLVSYLSYHFNLPLPVIAAGMDFISMAVVADMLRGAGAFFIRRSFVDDSLYWAVFQEYVQLLITDEVAPMEFFLEGTRSRSGKSLPPKLGLLGCVIECWLNGSVPDISIIPISISYSRTLEERLYAYEMLGVPKPKESTSGLLKAMSILKENYGSIHITVGDPISVRKCLEPNIDRQLYITKENKITKRVLHHCEELGLYILRKLQKGTMINVWSLASVCLMKSLWNKNASIAFTDLLAQVETLVALAIKLGASVNIENSIEETLRDSLDVHSSAASLVGDMVTVQKVHSTVCKTNKNKSNVRLSEETIDNAVTHLLLQHYCNQAIHIFIRPALVTLSLLSLFGSGNDVHVDLLQERFNFLRQIFGYDFIFERTAQTQDFMDGLAIVTWSGEVGLVHNMIHYVRPNRPVLEMFLDILQPFIITYQATVSIAASQDWVGEGELLTAIQANIESRAVSNKVYSALSVDSIKSAIKSVQRLGGLTKKCNSDGSMRWTPNQDVLFKITAALNYQRPVKLVAKL